MNINPGWKTTEFWITLCANIVGLLVLTGVFQQENSEELTQKINDIIGSIFVVFSNTIYIWSRVSIKKENINNK